MSSFSASYYEATGRLIRDVGKFTTERDRVLNALKADVLDNIDTAHSVERIKGKAECPNVDVARNLTALDKVAAKVAFGFDQHDTKVGIVFTSQSENGTLTQNRRTFVYVTINRFEE
jgi:hypothetical protein